MVTRGHLKKLLKEEKKFFKKDDVNMVDVEAYDEFSVGKIYKDAVTLEGMAPYFPDKFPKGRQCNKKYMFNIFNIFLLSLVRWCSIESIRRSNPTRYYLSKHSFHAWRYEHVG